MQAETIQFLLAGDVMLGRGIDQILRRPVDPGLYEPYVKDAREYVRLAEDRHGPIPRQAGPEYVWGDAMAVLERRSPAARIVNLETAVTRNGTPWPGKAIHYRMAPDHVACLAAAHIDCAVLANNHVLDWGYTGLTDTLAALSAAGVATAGAGADCAQATAPVELPQAGAAAAAGPRLLIFGCGHASSGIPAAWAAAEARAGVDLLSQLGARGADRLAARIGELRRRGDLVVVSIHWGGNWGYDVPTEQREFARRLVDVGAADVIHGHSSHHIKGFELYRGKLILYGVGDLINDYEGIASHEAYGADLALLYFVTLDVASGALVTLEMVPMCRRRFRLVDAGAGDRAWLGSLLRREAKFAPAALEQTAAGSFELQR